MTEQELATTQGDIWGVIAFLAICVLSYCFASDGDARSEAYINGERIGY